MLIALFATAIACKKKDNSINTTSSAVTKIDSVVYYDNNTATTYYAIEPFGGLSVCKVDKTFDGQREGYEFYLNTTGHSPNSIEESPYFSINIRSEMVNSTSAPADYQIATNQLNYVIEKYNESSAYQIKYSIITGSIRISEQSNSILSGLYSLTIKNGNTIKTVTGKFINYNPE